MNPPLGTPSLSWGGHSTLGRLGEILPPGISGAGKDTGGVGTPGILGRTLCGLFLDEGGKQHKQPINSPKKHKIWSFAVR